MPAIHDPDGQHPTVAIIADLDRTPWPDLHDRPFHHLRSATVGALADGTVRGAPVVFVRLDPPDGPPVLAEMTLTQLETVVRCLRARHPEGGVAGPTTVH